MTSGLQVTGAPVPLFSTQQDVSSTSTNIGIQVQTSTISNGATAQCVTGISFQPMAGGSVTIPFPASNAQVIVGMPLNKKRFLF